MNSIHNMKINQDTAGIILGFLSVGDILNLGKLSKQDLFCTKNVLNKFLNSGGEQMEIKQIAEKYLICPMCKCDKISYVKGFSFLENIPDVIPEDCKLPPKFSPMCINCLGLSYHSWLKNNSIILIKEDDAGNDREWLKVESEGIIIEKHYFTKYSFSHYCESCQLSVSTYAKDSLSVIEGDYLYPKYANSYHVKCFIDSFIIIDSCMSLSLKDLKTL